MSEALPWRLRIFASLASTSDLCASLAIAGEAEGLAVLALRQTHGRGRDGRVWDAPHGNLNLSVLLRPAGDATEGGRWSLIAAVALAETVEAYLPDPAALHLKWPNDLMLHGAKLSGILLDSALTPDGRLDWLVIGMGVNLSAAPDLPDRPTACLAGQGITPPTPEAFARNLLERLHHWRRTRLLEGFAPIRHAWLRRAAKLGAHITLRHGTGEVGGNFAGLSDDGHLLLQTGGRVSAFAAGEVTAVREGLPYKNNALGLPDTGCRPCSSS